MLGQKGHAGIFGCLPGRLDAEMEQNRIKNLFMEHDTWTKGASIVGGQLVDLFGGMVA